MGTHNLLAVSITAFTAVFILLALLAGVMRLITSIFPKVDELVSKTHIAVITTSLWALIPGSKVTRIEEIK